MDTTTFVTAAKSGVIVGVCSHAKNIADVKTLPEVITKANTFRKHPLQKPFVIEAIAERGK